MTWRSAARWRSPSGCAWPRSPASGSTGSTGSTRTSRRSGRPTASSGAARGSCSRRTTRRPPASRIAERRERAAAAVLSPRAAALAGLEILADDIQTVPDNRTRFVVVARPGAELPDAILRVPAAEQAAARGTTTTLVLGVRNEPGTLMACLAVLADEGINMHKLESRPSLERAWEYVFWVDVDGDVRAPAMARTLDRLAGVTTLLRVLGSYPRAEA